MTKARLTDKIALNMLIERLTKERDEALTELATAQKDLTCGQHEGHKMVWCNRCIEDERGTQEKHIGRPFQEVDLVEVVRLREIAERERDEALAQVTAMNNYWRPNEKLAGEIYAKASALLEEVEECRRKHGKS